MDERQAAKHEYEWVKHKDHNAWTLHMFPFFLTIEYRPREPQPYVGSLRGGLVTLRDHHAWPSAETAALGMVNWALEELSKSYHECAKLLPPQPQGDPNVSTVKTNG